MLNIDFEAFVTVVFDIADVVGGVTDVSVIGIALLVATSVD